MIWGYSKAGDMEMAKLLFDRMPVKKLIPWTILISGFAEKGTTKEAMRLYDEMEEVGLKPGAWTVIRILAACAESVYDRLHPKSEKIYEMIETLGQDLNEARYVPKVPVDVGEAVYLNGTGC
ncbi:hypothetical protein Patl1_21835 [Pistacia atlantica]|uniref:Uncharacterized protein n=1 Tax=Pistacia atlantica TaxID=434234 RepID=A0ACC1BKQ9_9ROSI|nr:hypothetical protein Patl1_21835 [Pistacia atlantica]